MPTDTVYGLAVDPFNEAAVGALYELKGRPSDKPLGLLVASAAEALTLIELPPWAVDLGSAHWPGALTLVAPPRVVFPDWVGHPRTRTV
ncbi:MAG: Sua5/YciO/YrdC/YwlC family protein, partial [Acidimicrobiia bacterium]|nr:Sua5/YciO/YrdC/YwlC family protein [Acidimicrobiia bacterium]